MKYERTTDERRSSGLRLVTSFSSGALAEIAQMTVIAIHDRCWEVEGKKTFEEYLNKSGVQLSSLIDVLKALEKNDRDIVVRKYSKEAIDLIDTLTRNPVGTNQHREGPDNVRSLRPDSMDGGNSSMRARRVLREKHPEMLERVDAGEMSYHQAMKMTGHRRSYLQVPADDLQAALGKIETHFKVKVRLA